LAGNYSGRIFAARSKKAENSSWKVDRMWGRCEQKPVKNFAGNSAHRIFATPQYRGYVLHKTIWQSRQKLRKI